MPHTNSPADPPEITHLIRAEARRYQPDSAAIRARVERAMADDAAGRARHARRHARGFAGAPRPGGTRLVTPARVATAGVALSVAGGGAWYLTSQQATVPVAGSAHSPRTTPRDATHPQGGNQGQAGSANARSATSTPVPGPQVTLSSSPAATFSLPPGGAGTQQNFLSSHGAIDPSSGDVWGESDVTLKNTKPMTALRLVLRLAATPGLASVGSWTTGPNAEMTITVTTNGGALVYTFTLRPGQTLPPGQYEFAGQYTHASGTRSASGDTYEATASSATSSPGTSSPGTSSPGTSSAVVSGNFSG